MVKKCIVLLYGLMVCMNIHAQNPPAQLPSLLEEDDLKMPVLHKGQNIENFLKKKIFVRAETVTRSVYAGEAFLVTYKLYTSLNSQARVSRQPLFTGCSVLELTAPEEPEIISMEGTAWHVFTIRKLQVTPLEEGRLELGKVYIDNVVQLAKEDGVNIENYSIQLSNEPVGIEVKALPLKSKPAGFSAIVGNYSIKASVDSNRVPAGENATLKITIRGTGNIPGVRLPYVDWPAGTEHFEGTDTQFVNQDRFPVEGYKTFEIPFIGSTEGKIEIPPVTFTFFDPAAKLYKTVSTEPIPVIVAKAITTEQQLRELVTEDVSNKKYLWIVGAIAATLAGIWLVSSIWKNRNAGKQSALNTTADTIKQSVKTLAVEADPSEIFDELNHLGSIEKRDEFLVQTKILLTKTLRQKTASLSVSEEILISELKANERYAQYSIACEQIYRECNRNLYSPLPEENIKEKIYFDLTALIKQLNRNNQSVNL